MSDEPWELSDEYRNGGDHNCQQDVAQQITQPCYANHNTRLGAEADIKRWQHSKCSWCTCSNKWVVLI